MEVLLVIIVLVVAALVLFGLYHFIMSFVSLCIAFHPLLGIIIGVVLSIYGDKMSGNALVLLSIAWGALWVFRYSKDDNFWLTKFCKWFEERVYPFEL